jgi:hypothetical protein
MEVLVGHHHEKTSLVMILNWRGVSANSQFAHEEACKDREEIPNIQCHDCQHAMEGQFGDHNMETGRLTAGNRVQPGGYRYKLSADRC